LTGSVYIKDGWVGRCVYIDDGWMDGWMDGWVDRCVYIDDRLNRLNYSPSSSLEVCGIFDNALWENRKSHQKVYLPFIHPSIHPVKSLETLLFFYF